MSDRPKLHLFEGYGIELEYMIVDRATLDVAPIADRLLMAASGSPEPVGDAEFGEIDWSNELVLHVLEMKTSGPARAIDPLYALFDANVRHANALLAPMGARLMPGGMHPWMDPAKEVRLWPHEYNEVYAAYDRVFGAGGHGFGNLQSTHINLPFSGDEEFGRLHAAIRLALPLLPALAAASPYFEGRHHGALDGRLTFYKSNQKRIPSIAGLIVPEPIYTQGEYEERILQRMYDDIAPLDPEGTLQGEFLNSRGAIARFGRGAIEIRVLDIQECPAADMAICRFVVALLRNLVAERWSNLRTQMEFPTERLAEIFQACIRDAEETTIRDAEFLRLFGFRDGDVCRAGALWKHLAEQLYPGNPADHEPWLGPLHTILDEGPLARRMLRKYGLQPTAEELRACAEELCGCLERNESFGTEAT